MPPASLALKGIAVCVLPSVSLGDGMHGDAVVRISIQQRPMCQRLGSSHGA